MKRLLINMLVILFVFGAAFGLTGFYNSTFDLTQWSHDQKVIIIMLTVLACVGGITFLGD